jgi:ABC-2 type transport system ATP-binding protein
MSVQPGEVYGFLGPNGAGKTTTIRMIVGLIKATSGTITICGHDITKDHDKAMQKVGCIVENPETYSYLSGYKNLVHYARLAGISNMEKRIREVVELVNLKDRIHDKVKRYSLGMRQRLGLAQALLNKPKLLILDEPTNGLDPAGIREFRDLMRQLANSGMAVFVSSHLLGEVQQLCDRVAILKDGVIVTEKDVKHLLETGSSTYHICVDQEQLALHLLNREQIPVQVVKSNMIQVEVNEEQIKWIVRFLVENNVNISLVEKSSDSLEELFLNLTEESGRSEMMKEKVKYYA